MQSVNSQREIVMLTVKTLDIASVGLLTLDIVTKISPKQ